MQEHHVPDATLFRRADTERVGIALDAPRSFYGSHRMPPWVRSWIARWVITIATLALYHQWLGMRFSNPYFGGDAGQYLSLGYRIATDAGTSLQVAVQSKSPMTALIAGVILRFSHASFVSAGIGIAPTSYDYVHYLAILATLICVVTGLIAWRYTRSARVGYVALLVAGLYTPFVINSERLLTEAPFALFLLLTLLCAHEALERRSIGYSTLTGACFFLVVATRIQYLLPLTAFTLAVLIGAIAVAVWRVVRPSRIGMAQKPDMADETPPRRRLAMRSLVVLSAMLLSVLAFLALGDAIVRTVPPDERFGGIGNNLILQQSPYAYALTDGWAPDGTYLPFALPDASALDRDVGPLATSGQSLRCTGSGYTTLVCLTRKSPRYTIERIALNEFRLWWYPHNDFHVDVGIVTALMPLYHRCIVIFGVIGLLLLLGERRRAWLLAAPVVFIAALFSMQHIEVRYAIPTIPFLTVGVSALLVTLGDLLAARWPIAAPVRWRHAPSWQVIVSALLVGGAVILLIAGPFLFMAHGATVPMVLLTRAMPLVILATYGLILLFRYRRLPRLVNAAAILVTSAILVIAILPALSETSDQWSVTLSNDQQQLVQKIIIPTAPSAGERPAILLDAQALDGDFGDLTITINERAIPLVNLNDDAIPLTQEQISSYYRWQFDESHGAWSAANIPQWIAIPIPSAWVRAGENDITLSMRQDRSHPHPVRIFGQFSAARNSALTMPALFHTSLWKTIFDGDPRIQEPATLQESTRYSIYRANGKTTTSDLSPARGIQRGTYHIFLGMLAPTHITPSTRKPSDTMIAGAVWQAATDTSLDTFWLYGTAPRNTRLSLVDDSGTLIAFTSGQTAVAQWHSDRADVAYAPAFKVSPTSAILNEKADPIFAAAPGSAAVQQYLSANSRATVALSGQTQEQFTGAYVVHLRQPIGHGPLEFLVTQASDQIGTSWATLVPRHEPEGSPQPAYVDITTADTAVENLGYTAAVGPIFFMIHSGTLRADAVVAQAASLLNIDTPTAVYLPVTAPSSREDDTPDGHLKSFWAYADPAIASQRAVVSIRLA